MTYPLISGDYSLSLILIFGISTIGMAFGRLRIFGLSLGYSGVLILSVIIGYVLSLSSVMSELLLNAESVYIYNLLGKLGTNFFIASVGLEAGKCFSNKRDIRLIKSFCGGALTVAIGLIIATIIILSTDFVSDEFIVGAFSGAMTSTPSLQLACELCIDVQAVICGYGVAYPIGLIFIVIFVQAIASRDNAEGSTMLVKKEAELEEKSAVPFIIFSVFLGILLNLIIPLGMTVTVLVSGSFFGYLIAKKRKICVKTDDISGIGLVLFLSSSGIQAGGEFTAGLTALSILAGIMISFGSVFLGYIVIKNMFGLSKMEALTIISGGMTSTPAIGALRKLQEKTEYALFTASYMGALTTLLGATYVLCIML